MALMADLRKRRELSQSAVLRPLNPVAQSQGTVECLVSESISRKLEKVTEGPFQSQRPFQHLEKEWKPKRA